MTKKNSLKALSKNKGFTLVELIVVLVILAILAAILVPTLLGYIDKARSEKDFATAQAIRVACQAEIDEAYGKNCTDVSSLSDAQKNAALDLVGATVKNKKYYIDSQEVSIGDVTIVKNHITKITVNIDKSEYTYDSESNTWSAAKKSS